MLWNMVDVLAIVVAIALIVLLGPDVFALKRWKERLTGSLKRQDSDIS